MTRKIFALIYLVVISSFGYSQTNFNALDKITNPLVKLQQALIIAKEQLRAHTYWEIADVENSIWFIKTKNIEVPPATLKEVKNSLQKLKNKCQLLEKTIQENEKILLNHKNNQELETAYNNLKKSYTRIFEPNSLSILRKYYSDQTTYKEIYPHVLTAIKRHRYVEAKQILDRYKRGIQVAFVKAQLEDLSDDIETCEYFWKILCKGVLYRYTTKKQYIVKYFNKGKVFSKKGVIICKIGGKRSIFDTGKLLVKSKRVKLLHLSQLSVPTLEDFIIDGLKPGKPAQFLIHRDLGLFLLLSGRVKEAEQVFIQAGLQQFFREKHKIYFQIK